MSMWLKWSDLPESPNIFYMNISSDSVGIEKSSCFGISSTGFNANLDTELVTGTSLVLTYCQVCVNHVCPSQDEFVETFNVTQA